MGTPNYNYIRFVATMTEQQTDILLLGEMKSCALTAKGSNYTFLSELSLGSDTLLVIYKPRDGEAPLWDFPAGTLYKRECAAYVLDDMLGWNIIPRTIIRDGTYGIGSAQVFIDHNPVNNYYKVTEKHHEQLRKIACFDLVANNTDRKADHIIIDDKGKLWGIDQGLTFHTDIKIRTVIWDFQGEDIPDYLLQDISDLKLKLEDQTVSQRFEGLLGESEKEALKSRIDLFLDFGKYPGLS